MYIFTLAKEQSFPPELQRETKNMLDSFTIQIYSVFLFKYNQIPSHAYLSITFLKNYVLESEEDI